jgi:hypothetical protein
MQYRCVYPLFMGTRAGLTISWAGHVRDSFGSSEEVARKEPSGCTLISLVLGSTSLSMIAYAVAYRLLFSIFRPGTAAYSSRTP